MVRFRDAPGGSVATTAENRLKSNAPHLKMFGWNEPIFRIDMYRRYWLLSVGLCHFFFTLVRYWLIPNCFVMCIALVVWYRDYLLHLKSKCFPTTSTYVQIRHINCNDFNKQIILANAELYYLNINLSKIVLRNIFILHIMLFQLQYNNWKLRLILKYMRGTCNWHTSRCII